MSPRAKVLPACLAAAGLLGAAHLAQQAFVAPKLRGEVAAALAAAVLAGAIVAPGPAEASLKYSVFGFGEGVS
eukprot:CAMPEP_0183426114 /NCGR_PEP_ID=MMETSP0370-20130417/38067_1 /TAXON_ID=268820 /ORGANISM="Peridinium aciculiferum, Strain PAER-2" /LENGTH=72 /DNA_ID=CAMNT_0025610481 /DNA_START=50 /DNA_END=264 /DNA_ORIENTATION=+